MQITQAIYEALRLEGDAVACLQVPEVLAAGATTTPYVSMENCGQVLFVIAGGAANDATATLDVAIQQATDSAGSGAKALAGVRGAKAIAQVTAGAGFATLNDLWVLEVRAEEMDVNNGFTHLAAVITVSGADTWAISAIAIRANIGYRPVSVANITEVVD